MKRPLACVSFGFVFLFLLLPSRAEKQKVTFTPGRVTGAEQPRPPLQYAGLVAEFTDPAETGLGLSVSYLVWREFATVIGPQTGVNAIPPPLLIDDGALSLLYRRYHAAALDLLRERQAPLLLWGAIQQRGTQRVVRSFLTLTPAVRDHDLSIRLSIGQNQAAEFDASISQTRFTFTPKLLPASGFFVRRLITLQDTPLYAQTYDLASPLESVPAGAVLHSTNMRGMWFAVRRDNGAVGYVAGNAVHVLPRQVTPSQALLTLHPRPELSDAATQQVRVQEPLPVLNIQHDDEGTWYYVKIGDHIGWVDGQFVRPHLALPAADMMLGLYYYRQHRFEQAAGQFAQFIQTPTGAARPVNLATAHQLRGACTLLSREPSRLQAADLQPFSEAVTLTPYDPAARNMRALATIGATRQIEAAVPDIQRSIALDRQDVRTRGLVDHAVSAVEQQELPTSREVHTNLEGLQRELQREEALRQLTRIRQGYHLRMKGKGKKVPTDIPQQGTRLTIDNRTGEALSLYFEGPEVRALHLTSGESTQIDLPAGEYQIAAEMANVHVKPVYGQQTYEAKSHYALVFQLGWFGTQATRQ